MIKLKDKNGIVTVFLCLILLVILSLIFTLLESARASALRERVQLSVNAAAQSAFAAYDRPLFDKYGLLLFMDQNGGASELSEMAAEYVEKNRTDGPGRDWTDFSSPEVDVLKYAAVTDDNGAVFIKAVSEYMTDCGLAAEALDFAEDFFSAEDLLGSTDILDDDGEPDFDKIQEKIEDIEKEEAEARKAQETCGESTAAEAEDEGAETAQYAPAAMSEVDTEEALKTYEGLLTEYKNMKNKGFLALTCDGFEDLSETPFDDECFPSALSDEIKSRTEMPAEETGFTDKILLSEYIISCFNCYTESKDLLQLEYVIAGKDSDLANMSSICKRLVGIRFASNLIFLHANSSYSEQAEAVALLIAAALEIPGADKAIRELLLIIWAVAEAAEDVKSLTKGEKVPLYKNTGEWKLSLESAASGEGAEKTSERGLDYKGYLHLLLYLKDPVETAYRAMDMIQTDIKREEKPFLMKNCVYAAKLSLKAEADGMFPFLPGKAEHHLFANSVYSYGNAVIY